METNANLVPMGVPKGFVLDGRTGEVFDVRKQGFAVISETYGLPNGTTVARGRFMHAWPEGEQLDRVSLRNFASLFLTYGR